MFYVICYLSTPHLCLSAVCALFTAYWHEIYFARLANKPYDLRRLDDKEVALTVTAYDADEEIAAKQSRLLHDDLRAALEQDHPAIQYDAMMAGVHKLLSELFRGAAPSIGQWPQSSAYYSVDVIFDEARGDDEEDAQDGSSVNTSPSTHSANTEEEFTPVAKLVEVNFMGDWHGVEAAVKARSDYEEWANDLMTVLATKKDISSNKRLLKL